MISAKEVGPSSGPPFLQRAEGVLQEVFGFRSFRDGQLDALNAIAGRADALVVMPTGSGKSLCYQVPALLLPGVTVVVSPLIALMKDQVDGLQLRGVPVTCINSSLSVSEQWRRLEALEAGAYKLVYIAPERFRSRPFCRTISKLNVALLAVDEAHCISQWGHDFRPDYRRLKEVRSTLGSVPVVALTATATPDVREDIVRELNMSNPAMVVTGFDRPNLSYKVQKVRGDFEKRAALSDFLQRILRRHEGPEHPSGIIYTGTRKHCEEVEAFLDAEKWPGVERKCRQQLVRAYHAGLDSERRREVQEDFMEGRIPWVTATNAFGMGVDKADIRFVVHYDLPGSLEAYYQEVGRAGRDGSPAECLLLHSRGDRYLQEFFIEGSNPSRRTIEEVYAFLWKLGQNPIFRSLVELHEEFASSAPANGRVSSMALRSAVVTLERGGALDRLQHYDNLAELRPVTGSNWEVNPFGEKGTIKSRIWSSLQQVFQRTDRQPASIQLEQWASELEMALDSLKRGIGQLMNEGWIRYTPPFRGRAIRLPDDYLPLEKTSIDFAGLEKRRQKDEDRLDDMLAYAGSRTCRRNALLRHFGEPQPVEECGRCDRCETGTSCAPRSLSEEEFTVVRKILSGVARVRGRCGRHRMVQMLTGSRAKGVLDLGLERLSTYGILEEFRGDDIKDLVEQLELVGCLKQEGDRYPVIYLTDKGRRVMSAEERIELVFPRSRRRAESPKPALPAVPDQDGDYDEELFQRLRHVRRQMANQRNLPAYRIFNDRTLKVMARLRPQDERQLLEVPGVGQRTLKLFGEVFLAEINRPRGQRSEIRGQ